MQADMQADKQVDKRERFHPRPGRLDAYWRRVRRLSVLLLAIWFVATFVFVFFARELAGFTLFGWPLPFYMAAQGLPLLYLLIVAVYVARMRRLDRQLKNPRESPGDAK